MVLRMQSTVLWLYSTALALQYSVSSTVQRWLYSTALALQYSVGSTVQYWLNSTVLALQYLDGRETPASWHGSHGSSRQRGAQAARAQSGHHSPSTSFTYSLPC